MRKHRTIVIGSGLAGLSAALELSSNGLEVLLLESAPYVGGRTASWNKDGMDVESGLHRVLGIYAAFPELVKKAGLKMKNIVVWEDELEVKIGNGTGDGPSYIYGASPPVKTFSSPFRNLLSLNSMPEVNLQLEFNHPAWPADRTAFGVGALLVTFTEQSRTTFPDKTGRLSIILSPPDKIIGLKDKEIFEILKRDAPGWE